MSSGAIFVWPFKDYRKNSKNWDTLNYHRDCPTNGIVAFYSAILHSKDSDRITNRVDTDQTAPKEQSDLGLHCLLRPICPNISNFYGNVECPCVLSTGTMGSNQTVLSGFTLFPLHLHCLDTLFITDR